MRESPPNALPLSRHDTVAVDSDGTTVIHPSRPLLRVSVGWVEVRPLRGRRGARPRDGRPQLRALLLRSDGSEAGDTALRALSAPERRRIARYLRVARGETQRGRGKIALPPLRLQIGELMLERPAWLAGGDLGAGFPLAMLRLWRAGEAWDGLTRLGDRHPRPLGLTAHRIRALEERAALELRLTACAEPLRDLPRAGEVLAVLR
ncbi:MAG: hypothetical protein KGM44_13115, partial [bacterium]|nr:hypothetical protein [bacterium]